MILGFDCSSKSIHVVSLSNDGTFLQCKKWISTKTDYEDRVNDLLDQFEEDVLIALKGIPREEIYVFIENPIFVGNPKSSFSISAVISGLKRVMYGLRIYRLGIDVKAWKKDVLADGNASKEKILAFAQAKWGTENITEQDYADAACIALFGVRRMGTISG